MVYLSADNTMLRLTAANFKKYAGLLVNPVFSGNWEQVWEKAGDVLLPIGSVAVTFNHMVMCDPYPAFGDYGTDVVRQWVDKAYVFTHKTAITAAVNLVAGYTAGATTIAIDTVSSNYGLQVGDTIGINAGAQYNVIKKITYLTVNTAIVELGFGLTIGAADNEVITTAHAADAPLYFDPNGELFGNLREITSARFLDFSAGTTVFNAIEAGSGAPAAGVTLAAVAGQDGAGGVRCHTALATGDALFVLGKFFDDLIRPETVGKATESKAARTSATVYNTAHIELKC
jgi:hypothetical protein